MRLKTFTAENMNEAMRRVRDQLGDDAIIVSTQRGPNGRGVRITAALDTPDPMVDEPPPRVSAPEARKRPAPVAEAEPEATAANEADVLEILATELDGHGVPGRYAERLIRAAEALGIDDPVLALAGALDAIYAFAPIPDFKLPERIALVGPPGAGKTLAVAKIATRAVMAKRRLNVVSTDCVRAGAADQLGAFTRILKLDLRIADGADSLVGTLRDCHPERGTVIDTAGVNPFDAEDVEALAELVEAADAEPVLVLPAGGDVYESADMARVFSGIGANRMITTRLDMTRRLGGPLVAAQVAHLRFADVSVSSSAADGLTPLNPVSLSRLLLPHYADGRKSSYRSELRA